MPQPKGVQWEKETNEKRRRAMLGQRRSLENRAASYASFHYGKERTDEWWIAYRQRLEALRLEESLYTEFRRRKIDPDMLKTVAARLASEV